MSELSASPPKLPRIELLDVARGVALVAMAIYHFAWDLEFFGWMAPSTTLQGGWLYFARGIASSFLFLVGISLVLAHGQGIRWPAFWKRFAQVAGAAALISAVTWFIQGGFIFFGILHAIALFSLVGLVCVQRHWLVPAAAAGIVLVIWKTYASEIFSQPVLWWVGLASRAPQANDYVPMFPWLAAVLFGIACARLFLQFDIWTRIAALTVSRPIEKPLSFIGRHSLVFYLVHQPILMGLVWTFTTFVMAPDRTSQFLQHCQSTCVESRSKEFCRAYCPCMVEEMKQQELLTPFVRRQLSDAQNILILETRDMCVARHQKHSDRGQTTKTDLLNRGRSTGRRGTKSGDWT
ncbi:MAG: heparan-alpha-glucosaminide N-acetyltransferase [Rhizobiaceae bacterium]